MITLTDIPASALPSGNPILIRGKTDCYKDAGTIGTAVITFVFPTIVAEDILHLVYGENSYEFVFKAMPDPKNPLELSLAHPFSHFSRFKCLTDDFDIIDSPPFDVIFSAKRASAIYDITLGPNNTASVPFFGNPAVPEQVQDNFKGYMRVYLQESVAADPDDNILLAELGADPYRDVVPALSPTEDQLDWEVQGALYSYFDVALPDTNTPIVHGIVLNYWIAYFESFGIPGSPQLCDTLGAAFDYLQATYGCVPHHEWDVAIFAALYLQGPSREFLTNAPDSKTIGPADVEWLSVYYKDFIGSLTVAWEATYYDGTTVGGTSGTVLDGSLVANDAAVFPTGPVQIGVTAVPTYEQVCKYQVWVTNDGSQVTPKREYRIDHKCHLQTCQVLFLGKLGNWDTVRFTGDKIESDGTSKVEAIVSRTADYSKTDPRYKNANVKSDKNIVLNSGYQTDDYIQWTNELLKSERTFIIQADGSYLPTIATKGGGSYGNASADLHTATFTFKIADIV